MAREAMRWEIVGLRVMVQAHSATHPKGVVMFHSPKDLVAGSPRRAGFLAVLARLERWLMSERIPYVIFGSVAASALINEGLSLDFDRLGAHDPAERMPDIDLLVPRASLGIVRNFAHAIRHSDFPVSIDTFWSECWIDFRPDSEYSFLTHRRVRLPARSELFVGCTASLLGQDITVLDPRILLHIYGAVGVARQKDVPMITGLVEAIASGAATSRFTSQDCEVFSKFMLARKERYPLFCAAKRTWVLLLDALPPSIFHSLTRHVQLPANRVFRVVNRCHSRESNAQVSYGPVRKSLARIPR